MIKTMIVLLIALLFSVIGCDLDSRHSNETLPSDRYQIAISNDGKVYRLDKKGGEMVVIEDGACKRIREPQPIDLTVDYLFRTEEGKVIQYKGKGNFVPSTRQLTLDIDAIDAELAKRRNKNGEAVPKRLPGETIPEYMKRTGQQ